MSGSTGIQRFSALAILAAATITATTNGASVDVTDFTGNVRFFVNAGATGAAGQTADVKLQHSSDGTTWTDVPNVAFVQITSAAPGHQNVLTAVDRLKQFVRAVVTLAGTSPTVGIGITMLGKRAY